MRIKFKLVFNHHPERDLTIVFGRQSQKLPHLVNLIIDSNEGRLELSVQRLTVTGNIYAGARTVIFNLKKDRSAEISELVIQNVSSLISNVTSQFVLHSRSSIISVNRLYDQLSLIIHQSIHDGNARIDLRSKHNLNLIP